jgi:hypothetical protein
MLAIGLFGMSGVVDKFNKRLIGRLDAFGNAEG